MKDNGIERIRRKGRNDSLVSRRNECMLARYYYYGYIKNKGYEETIKLLTKEFFLSAYTIGRVILDHTDDVQSLKQKGPTMFIFRTGGRI